MYYQLCYADNLSLKAWFVTMATHLTVRLPQTLDTWVPAYLLQYLPWFAHGCFVLYLSIQLTLPVFLFINPSLVSSTTLYDNSGASIYYFSSYICPFIQRYFISNMAEPRHIKVESYCIFCRAELPCGLHARTIPEFPGLDVQDYETQAWISDVLCCESTLV